MLSISSPRVGREAIKLLCSVMVLAGCAEIPLVPVKYRPNVVAPEGAANSTPVALMANFEGKEDDSFLVHNFYERAARWFPDRVVIFNEKDAGSRAVVALTKAKGAVVSGFFPSWACLCHLCRRVGAHHSHAVLPRRLCSLRGHRVRGCRVAQLHAQPGDPQGL